MNRSMLMRVVALATASGLLAGCADKDFTPPRAAFTPRITLQLTTTGQQQASFTPRYLLVAAAYQTAGDLVALGYKNVPYATGTQNVSLDIDLAPCLAERARQGKDGCSIVVGAALRADSVALGKDGDGDPFKESFDFALVGPIEVVPGKTPTIPAIDLSASRFAAVRFEGDQALRLGGDQTPAGSAAGFFFVTPGAGVVTGTGAPTLFTVAQGQVYPLLQNNANPVYPQLAVFQNGAWKRFTATNAPQQSFFSDVTALSASEAYIAAPSGLWKFDGSNIARVNNITDSLLAAGSTTTGAGKFAIAGGMGGVVWLGNTTVWQKYLVPGGERIDGVCITGPTEAFAASSFTGGLYRFDGLNWTAVPFPGATAGKFDLRCPGPGQAFVINNNGPLLRWTGTGWTTIPTTGLTPGRLIRWSVTSATEMYAYADSASVNRAFYRFDGASWKEVGRLRFTQGGGRVWADPRGGAAYVFSPFGRVEQVTPSGVTVVSYQPAVRDLMVTSATSAFIVGWNSFLARWDGGRWNVDAPPANTQTLRILQGVWSDGARNAWTVGNSSTIYRYDGTGWGVVSDVARPIATADNYNAVWGAGSDVWAVGDNTILHCRSTTSCVNEPSGGAGPLYSVWGSSATNVFAVGAGGRITRFNGSAWTAMTNPTGNTLMRVAGSGPNDVWAVGDSVLLHFDGSRWANVPLVDDLQNFRVRFFNNGNVAIPFQAALTVRGPREAYIGGEGSVTKRWDGVQWRDLTEVSSFNGGRKLIGLSSTASGCVLALADGGSDSPMPLLFRGLGATGCFNAPMAGPTSWP